MPFNSDFLKVAGKNVDTFFGVFKPNGASAISDAASFSLFGSGSAAGTKFSVARAGTGLYTVTLESEYGGIVGVVPFGFNLGARWVDCVTTPGALAGTGANVAKQFQLVAKDNAGAAADITAGATVFVGFLAFLKAKGTVAGT